MKKKVLFISSASVHTKKFIEMLDEEFDIYVLTNNKEFFSECKIKDIYQWRGKNINNIFYTFKIVKEIKPDLISIQQIGLYAFFYVFLLHSKYKILLTSWGSDIKIYPYRSIFSKFCVKYSVKKATYLSSINSIGMISVLQSLSDLKKEIIPINFGISKYIEFEKNFNKKSNIMYSPRNHNNLYNIDRIIYSFASFSKLESSWELYISGAEDSINTPVYKNLVKELGIEKKVRFLGFLTQEENSKIFKKSKVVISIPNSDGRPISLMEAISSNCIVICSEILANYELVSNGVNGYLVDNTKLIDLGIYKNVDIDLMTKYNYKVSQEFHYAHAKNEYVKLFKGLLSDNNSGQRFKSFKSVI